MKISIFLPVLCRSEKDYVMTEACVKLMRACTALPFELVIVETESHRCEHLADVYLHQPVNPGVVPTHNIGFALCSGDLIGSMSNDVYVTPGWLECLVECFDAKSDCGAATLAACELGHRREEGRISEGLYFPCSIWRKEHAQYDEGFIDTWGDADMCTAMYTKGQRMYRNYRSMVHHLWNQTIPQGGDYQANWQRNFEHYKAKWAEYAESWIYKVFTEGHIV